MYVNVAVLKETQPHERRVALGALRCRQADQAGRQAAHAVGCRRRQSSLTDAAFKDVVFIDDRHALVGDADVVLGVQPPALDVIDAMKEGAILISFIYADKEPQAGEASSGQEDHLLRHGADSAHHAGAGDGCAVQPIGLGWLLRRATRRDPSGPRAAEDHHQPRAQSGPPRCW